MGTLHLCNKNNNIWHKTALSHYRLLPSVLSLVLLLILLVSFQARAALTPSPIIVDSQVKVSFSEFEFNRRSNTFDVGAKLTNRSATPISTPIRLVIKNIKPNTVTLANATGLLPDGSPYVDVSLSENDDDEHEHSSDEQAENGLLKFNNRHTKVPLSDNVLSPGEKVKNVLLKFNNPKRVKFTFNHSVLGVIPRANHPPVANAGTNQNTFVGNVITLDGSGSTDEDGDPLTYHWRVASQPATNAAALDNANAIKPQLTINSKGSYQIELIVNDGSVNSTPATLLIATENSKPVAVAGDDQTVFVTQTALLDGLLSHDIDGDPLTFHWQLSAKPVNSLATLQNPDAQMSSLTPDKPGPYTLELVVNDSLIDSLADQVIINTQNSKPVAHAGADQIDKTVGIPVELDGSLSSDADGDALTYIWSLLHQPEGSSAVIQQADQVKAAFTPDKTGDYIGQLIANDGQANSDPATSLVTVSVVTPVNNPPQITTGPLPTATVGSLYSYDVDAVDPDNDTLSYSLTAYPSGMTINAQSGLINWTPAANQTGAQSVNVAVTDGKGGSDSQSYTVTVAEPIGLITVPNLSNLSRGAAETAIVNAKLTIGTPVFINNPAGSGSVISQSPNAGSSVAEGTTITLTLSLGPDQGLPPDPAITAPKIDTTVATTVSASTDFLYTGSHPIQTGVTAGTIDAKRVAVIRGKVLDKQNNPLPGVTVTVSKHPELGQTLSRADGLFDLAVNGGGLLTVDYWKDGYLPVQRQIQTPWQDYVAAEDVVMLALDAQVTAIDLNAAAMQAAQGSVMTDADGSRQVTMLFPAGTQVTMTLPDGTQQALTSLHVRATEYTVGENGPKSMPGPLPPTSGYTYAVELSADEAVAAGAKTVTFDRPVPFYVDNFLNFPVGETVPVGWYDRDKTAWIPSANGKVIKILSIANGLADLDTDGDSLADDAVKLATLGIDDAERQQLAQLYAAGKTVWRTPIGHFTPWDCNWPYGPPKDAVSPPPPDDTQKPTPDQNSDKCPGCSINPQARTVGEELPVTGTPYSLHYQSRRAQGYKQDRIINIPLTGASVSASLQGIDLSVTVAGQRFTRSFTATPNQSYRFEWDGLDGYDRPVTGIVSAAVTIGYRYNAVYYAARSDFEQSFAQASSGAGTSVIGSRVASTIALTRTWQQALVAKESIAQVVDGWSLSVHHNYDAVHRMLEIGTGERRGATDLGQVITRVAGTGYQDFSGDGGPAVLARLSHPTDTAFGPDGSFYIADAFNYRIRRVGADGTITTVAGTGQPGYSGDGGPATQAKFDFLPKIAVSPDGGLYIADSINHRIRRVDTDGIITTVAGIGIGGDSGDGGPATQAQLNSPEGIDIGADGSLYIVDSENCKIRRVDVNGIITTVVGTGECRYGGDSGPAIQAKILYPKDIAIGPDNSLYILETSNNRIRRVGTDGIITTVSGTGQSGYSGDGGPATQAQLNYPQGIAVGPDNSLYIADCFNSRIRRVDTDGIISTIAGTGQYGFPSYGGPATQAQLWYPGNIAISPGGGLYIADKVGSISRVAPPLSGFTQSDIFISSANGNEIYHFDADGKHLRTLNALTRSVIYAFSYNDAGLLSTITDVDGDITRIERDVAENANAITAADGQRTTLTLAANGYLASVVNPAGETHSMTYTTDGLLTAFTDPNSHANTFSYDELGRLNQDIDAGGGGWTITASQQATGYTTAMATGERRTVRFAVDYLSTGDRRQTNTSPDGTVQTRLFNPRRYLETATAPDGMVSTLLQGPDPRFGMQAPLAISNTVKTPAGLTATVTRSRSAVLANVDDPLSLTTLTETATINGKTSRSVFNAADRSFIATSPASRTATTTIDTKGRPVNRAIPGLDDVNLSYDARGRLNTTRQGLGTDARTTDLAYYDSGASQGYLHTVTDALNRTVSYDYDLAGRVTRQTLPDGRAVEFAYDAKGNLTSLIPPGQPAHLFDYTAVNQTQNYIPPTLDTTDPATRYSYNRDKQLELITRPDGQILDLIYDSAGRLQTLAASHGDTAYSYDSAGRLQSLAAPGNITLSYAYDGALMTGTALTGAGTVSRSYDADFRIKTLSVNGANAFTFGYDNDSLLTSVGNATLGVNLTLTRDARNGLLTGTALGSLTDSYSYNGFGEVTNYLAKFATADLYKTDVSRDKLGRITQKIETVGGSTSTFDYAYDVAGRLVEVKQNGIVQSSYGYDDNGNRTDLNGAVIAHYDAQDRLLDYNNASYDYTANGELKTKSVGTAATRYHYDVLGNLRQVTLPNGTAIDYLIDGQNRRIGKKRNNVLDQGFLYQDQLKPIAELDGNNSIVSRFVYATGANVPDFMIKGGVTYRLVKDHLGSPRLVVDVATNTVIQQMSYDVWGKVIQDSNPGFQPFGYAGGLYDRDTHLVRFGARDYDVETGRWTAKDPIGFAGGDTNLYGYVVNDPVNLVDLAGLCDCRNVLDDALGLNNDSDYGFKGKHGPGPSTNKCNTFVDDALKNTDVPPRRYGGLGGAISAGTWADPGAYIPHFPITNNPQPGDIIAIAHDYGFASGHVAIVVEPGKTTIGAGSGGSHITGWPWDPATSPQGTPVYRHCSCTRIGQ
ncbi:MAG: PKD domain-containing protein [Methylococcaceae bacterium]